MKLKSFLGICTAAVVSLSSVHAASATYTVDALGNSSSGGAPLPTFTFNLGDAFSTSVDVNDLWNAGSLPRWSNADGLVVDRFATGSDDSGESAGTHIGQPFALWTQDGFTAPYGSLVGKIGSTYIELGTSYSGLAPAAGVLNLMYWDENNGDNSESIKVTVSTPRATTTGVPDAGSTSALLGLGIVGLMGLRSRFNRA